MEENSTQGWNRLDKDTGRSGAHTRIFQCSILEARPTQLQSRGFDLEESIYGDSFSQTTKSGYGFSFMGTGQDGENLILSVMRSPL